MEKKLFDGVTVDGITVDEGSLVTALKIIKTVCDAYQGCSECPMCYKRNLCLVKSNYPGGWNINDPNSPWKALFFS